MFGSIIGDFAGSIYEYSQTKEINNIIIDNIIEERAFYSDDTILTIAIADAILNDRNYDKYLRYYIKKYSNYRPNIEFYFKSSFSPNLIKWANSEVIGNSIGNGAMMRISPVGFMFADEKEVIENVRLATIPSHNSEEAIDAATIIALIIFYLKKGYTKYEVFNKLNIKLEFKPFNKFNITCKETLKNCLYVFYYSNSFEDAIRKAIYMGGDTDTNASIVGAMAEACYQIDDYLINNVKNKLPEDFVKVLSKVYK